MPETRLPQPILALSRRLAFRKGETVLPQEPEARSFCLVEKGAVEVSYTTRETRIVVALIGQGELFGEVGFLDGVSRVRNIRAVQDTWVRLWDREGLEALKEQDPRLYAQVVMLAARSVCAKFRRILEEQEPLTAYAASLSTGRRAYREPRPLPDWLLQTPAWGQVNRMVESFKADFFELSHGLQAVPSGDEIPQEQRQRCFTILDQFNEALELCRTQVGELPTADLLWGYVFKEIFPYFMRSRFAERAYYKPKGYAGDFLMMEMIYENRPSGDGLLGTLVDAWCLETAAARAVRGRRNLMSGLLERFAAQRPEGQEPFRIINLACGSNRELFDFLARWPHSAQVEAFCMDADPEALQYTHRVVDVVPHEASIRLMRDNVVKWALGRTSHRFPPADVIYSVGLTDYLDRRIFQALARRAYEHLKPGGVFIVGNFSEQSPNRAFMDHLLQWNLIYRSENELTLTLSETPFGCRVEVAAEPEGINLFALATKHPAA